MCDKRPALWGLGEHEVLKNVYLPNLNVLIPWCNFYKVFIICSLKGRETNGQSFQLLV